MFPEFNLEGKTAIVTGARGTLGRATALALGEAGANVVLGDREPEGLDAVKDTLRGMGREAVAVVCDISSKSEVDALIQKAVDAFGQVDIMVANAGVFQTWLPPEENTLEEWDRVLGINLTGVMLSCMAAGRQMIHQGSGSIVAMSSIVGQVGLAGNFSYNVAKHGVLGIVRSLAVEWAEHDIRVNAVCPGFIVRDNEPLREDPRVNDMILTRTPLKRWGEPRDIALAVAYLASPAAKYVTGTALAVDGGWLAL